MTAPARRRPVKQLDPDTLARLRAQVGLTPDGQSSADEPDPPVEPKKLTAEDEVALLRAALDDADRRREDLRAELHKHIDSQTRRAELAERQRDQLRAEVADRTRERDADRAEAMRAVGALEAVRRVRDDLAGQLAKAAMRVAAAEELAETWQAEYERIRDDKLDEIVDATRHRHAWEWQPGLKWLPLPCSCGLPWPRPRPPDLATVVPLRQPKGSNR